jgi:hypothetical protein
MTGRACRPAQARRATAQVKVEQAFCSEHKHTDGRKSPRGRDGLRYRNATVLQIGYTVGPRLTEDKSDALLAR